MSPCLACMEYFPSKSVSVPVCVPLIITLTPGSGPLSSETVPETVFFVQKQIAQSTLREALKFH